MARVLQIFGDDEIEPVGHAKQRMPNRRAAKFSKICRPVALVTTKRSQGTGFLIRDDLVVTNNHVFMDDLAQTASREDAKGATVKFNFEDDDEGNPLDPVEYECLPQNGFHASLDLDYGVVAVANSPGQRWGVLPTRARRKVRIGDPVIIVQHPDGQPKSVARRDNKVLFVGDERVQYRTDTVEGSSGSPVFNENFALIAIHHAGGLVQESDNGPPFVRNEGILITAVLRDLARNSQLLGR